MGAIVEWLAARLGPVDLCISPTTAVRLQALLHVSPSRIGVIPRGFSRPPQFDKVPPKQPFKVVVANRLLNYKRVDLILRAWAQVAAAIPEAELHIIGDGPQRTAWEQLAAASRASAEIHFHGQLVRRESVLKEIATASLLVQPSVREGQSTVVLEAMALGTAVLAAEGPETAVADFLGRGPNRHLALLPVEASPDAWAERIVTLLNDRPLLEQMAKEGQEQVADFDWKASIAPRVEEFYRSVVSGRRRAITR